ncbi:hypothetical protein [Isobaculum melis]|uniref:Uncharacterized protein n=1 Tax=Isobaculum melis TaxID=142588 RepID=A0A1H9SLW2_9LACT|nr:hypothetical protein [Isobaculum melis]SER85992.1 hypothetical protein SAMN04488559_10819 [Isobaculum melis]
MIKNVDAQKPEDVTTVYETANVFASSVVNDSNTYTTSALYKNNAGKYFQINTIVPEYYQYMGHILTDSAIPHTASQMQIGVPVIDKTAKNEYWITLYLQPTTTSPKPYSWAYIQAIFNKIK